MINSFLYKECLAWGNLDVSLKFLVFFDFVPIRNRYLSDSGQQFENTE